MTRERSFKRLVRARMAKTGQSYATARAALLAVAESPVPTEAQPVLTTSDAEILRRTGRGWEEWFDRLDGWDADKLTHREIARRVAAELGIEPLVWEAQAVTVSYERARGLRVVGQRGDGSFAATASKTIAVPADRVFAAFASGSQRQTWLPDGQLSERTAVRPRSLRFDWADGRTRVNVVLDPKDATRTTVAVEHGRLADAEEAARLKAFWRERLTSLKSLLEGGQTGSRTTRRSTGSAATTRTVISSPRPRR